MPQENSRSCKFLTYVLGNHVTFTVFTNGASRLSEATVSLYSFFLWLGLFLGNGARVMDGGSLQIGEKKGAATQFPEARL